MKLDEAFHKMRIWESSSKRTPENFGKALRTWLWSEDIFDEFMAEMNCGWSDGGCRILSDALFLWLSDYEPELMGIVSTSKNSVEHVLVRVGNLFFDSDGASSEKKLLKRWRDEELIKDAVLSKQTSNEQILANREMSNALYQRISEKFGTPAEWGF